MTDLDHMSMQNVALFSGLIGALISSGLSYFIRATLDRHNLKEAELRITYVHFVKISQIVAIDAVAKIFLNAYATEELKAAIKSKDGLFEPSHAISVIIAQQIQKQTPETIKAAPGISFVTAESIHDQWLSITKFFEHARLLHSALQRAGSITNNEANALIRKQSKIMTERYFNKLKHKPKLEAALADANKAVA